MLLRKLEAAEAAVRGMQGTLLSMADGAKAAGEDGAGVAGNVIQDHGFAAAKIFGEPGVYF